MCMSNVIEHIEKELKRYVIATFDNPTNYVVCNGQCVYSFIDNIQMATKFANKEIAYEVYNSLMKKYSSNVDLVVLPLKIKYVLLEDVENG